jgi:hypothetical protein
VGVGFCVSAQTRLYGSPVFCACVHAHPLFAGFTEIRCATRIGYTSAWYPLNDGTKNLITDAERAQLLANGVIRAQGQAIDPIPVVKLFTLDAHATWLLAELDPNDGDTAAGLIDLGLGAPELGTVRISVLEAIRGPRDLRVCRDMYFTARFTLSEYARRARADGSIND